MGNFIFHLFMSYLSFVLMIYPSGIFQHDYYMS